ncbi:MAG TPA: ectonucleotide pyrophosphatase/phosphodiesterase [Caulobacteraceae bacterium]|jgi:predicted AlkP superfamily pyrophosphatase or phosphodiesterase|nr:ectonucleotide pyrophosphatase/phosphodiesterase [Caulobacteraceae bacterium]
MGGSWRAAALIAVAALTMALTRPPLTKPQAAAPATVTRPLLLVISIDGFRADYLDRGLTPNLDALAHAGVRAKAMRPAFPSVTSPNHYTLMTGLYPDHHGIVDNEFVDPAMPGTAFGGPHGDTIDRDPRWWEEATPLWVTAERAGLKTAASDWPGDDGVVIHGVKSTYLAPPPKARGAALLKEQVDGVLAWIDMPADQRPAFIRLHFDPVDLQGHLFGPDSAQVNAAISQVDTAIGDLVGGLKARGVYERTNIVVVSDHGMATISPDQLVVLDDLIDLKRVTVPTFGAETGVDPQPDYHAEAERILLAPHEHLRCWRRQDIPARLHYGSNPRVPEIFCLADLGWSAGTHAQFARYPRLHGNHGYEPTEPTMKAIFIARGPAFRSGVVLPEFDNVEIYPVLARLLQVKAERSEKGDQDLREGLVH